MINSKISLREVVLFVFAIFIATYLWRIPILGILSKGILAAGIFYGILKNGRYLIKPRRLGGKYLYIMILGVAISFFYAAYIRGSVTEQLELNNFDTHLTMRRNVEGILLFFFIILNYDTKEKLLKLLDVQLYIGVIFTLMMLLRISDVFVSALGVDLYFETVVTETYGVDMERYSFATLDPGSFGGLTLFFALFCAFKYYEIKPNKRHIIFFVLFTLATLITISRTVIIKFVISVLVYLFLSFKINLKTGTKFVIVGFIAVIIFFNTSMSNNITLRFTEVFYNLQEFYHEGELVARDSFQYRLVRALVGVPKDLEGWIMGSGGIQTARLSVTGGADHIEYTNWLWQFGLITFIPFIVFLGSLIRRPYKLNKKTNSSFIKHLTAYSIGVIVCLMIHMIGAPSFYYLWIWTAFSVVLTNISYDVELRNYKSFREWNNSRRISNQPIEN